MDKKEQLELLLKKISRYDVYINSTNAKTSIIIAWNGIVIGTILLKYNSFMELYVKPIWAYGIANALLLILAVTSFVSIALAFKVINPFLSSRNTGNNFDSLIFFGDVSKITLEEYKRKESNLNYEDILTDAIRQAHNLAIGLNNKMKCMKKSIAAIYYGLVSLLILILLKGIITYAS